MASVTATPATSTTPDVSGSKRILGSLFGVAAKPVAQLLMMAGPIAGVAEKCTATFDKLPRPVKVLAGGVTVVAAAAVIGVEGVVALGSGGLAIGPEAAIDAAVLAGLRAGEEVIHEMATISRQNIAEKAAGAERTKVDIPRQIITKPEAMEQGLARNIDFGGPLMQAATSHKPFTLDEGGAVRDKNGVITMLDHGATIKAVGWTQTTDSALEIKARDVQLVSADGSSQSLGQGPFDIQSNGHVTPAPELAGPERAAARQPAAQELSQNL